MAEQQPRSSLTPTPVASGQGTAVQPLTEWLLVMTEEVQRKEEAARVAAAESARRA